MLQSAKLALQIDSLPVRGNADPRNPKSSRIETTPPAHSPKDSVKTLLMPFSFILGLLLPVVDPFVALPSYYIITEDHRS
jgi:hypothetical protein